MLSSSGNGVLILGASEAYTGPTTITSGALQLGDGNPGDDATLTSSSILDNGSLIFNYFASQNPGFTIRGSGSVTAESVGLLILSNSNSYSGGTLINVGTLQFTNANGLGTGPVTFTGPSALQAGVSGPLANQIGSNPNVTGTLDNQGNSVTLTGGLTGAGALAMIGGGTFTLTGSSNNTGAIYIDGGLVALGSTNALSTTTGTISFGGGILQYSAQNGADYSGRIANSASAITIDTNGQNVTFANQLLASNNLTGGFVKDGAGTLTLMFPGGYFASGANYTGSTIINGGTLKIGTMWNAPIMAALS